MHEHIKENKNKHNLIQIEQIKQSKNEHILIQEQIKVKMNTLNKVKMNTI